MCYMSATTLSVENILATLDCCPILMDCGLLSGLGSKDDIKSAVDIWLELLLTFSQCFGIGVEAFTLFKRFFVFNMEHYNCISLLSSVNNGCLKWYIIIVGTSTFGCKSINMYWCCERRLPLFGVTDKLLKYYFTMLHQSMNNSEWVFFIAYLYNA